VNSSAKWGRFALAGDQSRQPALAALRRPAPAVAEGEGCDPFHAGGGAGPGGGGAAAAEKVRGTHSSLRPMSLTLWSCLPVKAWLQRQGMKKGKKKALSILEAKIEHVPRVVLSLVVGEEQVRQLIRLPRPGNIGRARRSTAG
jgi:hypothetical protein